MLSLLMLSNTIKKRQHFPKQQKSEGFSKGSWHPQHREHRDSYTEFGGAASNLGVVSPIFFWGRGEQSSYGGLGETLKGQHCSSLIISQ